MPRAECDLPILAQAEDHHQPGRAIPIIAGVGSEQRQSERLGEQLVCALRIVHRHRDVIEPQ